MPALLMGVLCALPGPVRPFRASSSGHGRLPLLGHILDRSILPGVYGYAGVVPYASATSARRSVAALILDAAQFGIALRKSVPALSTRRS